MNIDANILSKILLSTPTIMAVIILASSNQNYQSVAPNLKEVSGVTELKISDSLP
jgi:hypothetical protein